MPRVDWAALCTLSMSRLNCTGKVLYAWIRALREEQEKWFGNELLLKSLAYTYLVLGACGCLLKMVNGLTIALSACSHIWGVWDLLGIAFTQSPTLPKGSCSKPSDKMRRKLYHIWGAVLINLSVVLISMVIDSRAHTLGELRLSNWCGSSVWPITILLTRLYLMFSTIVLIFVMCPIPAAILILFAVSYNCQSIICEFM